MTKNLTIKDLRSRGLILFETLSGSRAYGLDTPESDTDIKGVFILPKEDFYGFHYVPQVNNPTSDIVFYELGRFLELLEKNNPNLLEMLFVDDQDIIYKHPLFDRVKPEIFLSRLCRGTFAGYAVDQIKKARSLNKKILNPIDKRKKTIMEFCYIIEGYKSRPLLDWLDEKGIDHKTCGLTAVPHTRELYALFTSSPKEIPFTGLIKKDEGSTDLALSSIPKGRTPEGLLSFNKDGYTLYCKEYASYWEWVKKRNPVRYNSTMSHGKKYDAKNMMHTFRLLDIAEEIARTGAFTTRRPNRQELLTIKRGEHSYEELIEKANKKIEITQKLFDSSPLPPKPQKERVNRLCYEIRNAWYMNKR